MALVLWLLALSASAQTPLATALAARFPAHELVPQSCRRHLGGVEVEDGRLCLFDDAGRVRAVRRIGLASGYGYARAAMFGSDVVFVVYDEGGAATRFLGRAWRWDLTRDAYLSLANVDGADVRQTSFGALYQSRAGWHLHDASGDRAVTLPDPIGVEVGTIISAGTGTYFVHGRRPVQVDVVTLSGTHLELAPHAVVPGDTFSLPASGLVVTASTGREHTVEIRVLRLPAAAPVMIPMPAGMRPPTSLDFVDDHTLRLRGPRREVATLDLTAGTIVRYEGPADPEPLRASSLHQVAAAAGGVYLATGDARFQLDATGITSPRGAPRLRSPCRCDGESLVCEGGPTIAGACVEVQELDRIQGDMGPRSPETLYTPDGRFRIDRLEADYVRVTRLSDGARLWARVLGRALLAQLDDGGYFTTDRTITDRVLMRDSASPTAAVAPLGDRATSLFRPTLVADFFATAH